MAQKYFYTILKTKGFNIKAIFIDIKSIYFNSAFYNLNT